jgi:hypothetical protein
MAHLKTKMIGLMFSLDFFSLENKLSLETHAWVKEIGEQKSL